MQLNLSQLENAFELREGLPRPNWELIYKHIPQNLPDDQLHSFCNSIAIQWLQALAAHLPDGYSVAESPNFFVLSRESLNDRSRIVSHCEYHRTEILKLLGNETPDIGFGKHLLLAFHEQSLFVNYVVDYFPNGIYGTFQGVFVNRDYHHITLCTHPKDNLANTITHELIHNLLSFYPLPHWLDEGLTMRFQRTLMKQESQRDRASLSSQHKNYWNKLNIQDFHKGMSFPSSGPARELSYALSHTLVHNLFADFPDKMKDFIRTAHYNDSGDAALQATCGVSLSDRIAQTLGPGNWSPITPLFPPPNASDPA
jgi:hypothetical protein